jgi:hypothetical protein
MQQNLITEIKRIKEIIFGSNIISEQTLPAGLSREIFDFALRQGDEFIELIRPIAQKEASATGKSLDDVIDFFEKQVDDYNAGFTTEKKFSDETSRVLLRNLTTEEFVEFLLKAKILPTNVTSVTDTVVKRVAENAKKGIRVNEEFIDEQVKAYENSLQNITYLDDSLKEALSERFRKQLNVARYPVLSKVGTDLTPESIMRYALPDSYDKLNALPEFKSQFRKIESQLIGKTWGDAVEEAILKIDYLKSEENFKKLTGGLSENQKNYLSRSLDKLKSMLVTYRKEKYMGAEVLMKGPDGKNVINPAKTMGNIGTALFASTGLIYAIYFFVSWLDYISKEGATSGTAYMFTNLLKDLVSGVAKSFEETRKEYSLVTEEDAKNYLTEKMGLNLEDYTFETDPQDKMKMTALYIGEGDGVDYLIYREDKVIKHKVYTEEDRNKSLIDILTSL